MLLGRRELLVGGGAITVAAASPFAVGDLVPASPPLRAHAAARGLSYGAMMDSAALADPQLRKLIAAECDIIVTGVEMKWGFCEAQRGKPAYGPADLIAKFARDRGLKLRGHTAFWYLNMPAWAQAEMKLPGYEQVITQRVTDVVRHFGEQVVEWDVVNEAIEPKDRQTGALRLAPFGRAVGTGWLGNAFHAAHAASPKSRLFYNDFGMEYDTPDGEARRTAILALLTGLVKGGVPIHGLGIQAHVGLRRPFSAAKFGAFLAEVAALGLKIRLTEFDVADHLGFGPALIRDQQVASYARAFLDAALAQPAVTGVLTWGTIDRTSWMQPRKQPGVEAREGRPLPFDDALQRKPLWHALADAFDAAPKR